MHVSRGDVVNVAAVSTSLVDMFSSLHVDVMMVGHGFLHIFNFFKVSVSCF